MHLLAHSAAVHTCHTPDCMILVPVLLTWHSMLAHLVQPTSPLHNNHIQVLVTSGELGLVTRSIPDIWCSFH
jgi:hypothetical protein